MDARGDLVGPRPSLQRSALVCPHPEALGVVGGVIAHNSFFPHSPHPLPPLQLLERGDRIFLAFTNHRITHDF
jgi:hypothetical protein